MSIYCDTPRTRGANDTTASRDSDGVRPKETALTGALAQGKGQLQHFPQAR